MLYDSLPSTPLAPALLSSALALVFADILAVLALLGVMGAALRWIKPRTPTAAALLAIGLFASAMRSASRRALRHRHPPRLMRQRPLPTHPPPRPTLQAPPSAAVAQRATENVTLGYVLTGDPGADATSKAGLSGLSRILAVRTAVEPGEPLGSGYRQGRDRVLSGSLLADPRQRPPAAAAHTREDRRLHEARRHDHFRHPRLRHRPANEPQASKAATAWR